MLESLTHAESSFVTLTYRPEVLPPGGTLVPKDYQNWLKRLRKAANHPLRFFLCGEYGDQTQRPHYHAAIFGLPPHSPLFQQAWSTKKHGPLGMVHAGTLTPDSAQYIAGYVVKKLNGRDKRSEGILNGRFPEFARMSNRPGIGATAVPAICDALTTSGGCDSILLSGDVPLTLKQGSSQLPLGRYLRSKLRAHLGFKETSTPPEIIIAMQHEAISLLNEALKKPENKNSSIQKILVDVNKQKVLNLETRQKIYSKKGLL